MNLQYRVDLLSRLGEYILSDDPQWQAAKEKAGYENGWFIPEFVELSARNIATSFLQKEILEEWAGRYNLQDAVNNPKKIGIIMAGNIPMVGFHDLLCVLISGHQAIVKLSSKDKVLTEHLAEKMTEWDGAMKTGVVFQDMLKGCNAYIATGSNNSSRYFEYYFEKYPHIIRRNRTSVAILSGKETNDELEKLGDDVYQYFGLGCRNVTKIYVPRHYDFVPLLAAFKKYNHLAEHHKYKNNYDYNLAIALLNKVEYMTNGSILLVENASLFSPISQLNYEFYENKDALDRLFDKSGEIQCVTGHGHLPFGQAQCPSIMDYADGVDTLKFLVNLP